MTSKLRQHDFAISEILFTACCMTPTHVCDKAFLIVRRETAKSDTDFLKNSPVQKKKQQQYTSLTFGPLKTLMKRALELRWRNKKFTHAASPLSYIFNGPPLISTWNSIKGHKAETVESHRPETNKYTILRNFVWIHNKTACAQHSSQVKIPPTHVLRKLAWGVFLSVDKGKVLPFSQSASDTALLWMCSSFDCLITH